MVEYGRLPAIAVPIVIEMYRHTVNSNHVAKLVQQLEKKTGDSGGMNIGEYDRLLKMAERESRGIARQSTKLRALLADRPANVSNLQIGKPW